MKRKLPAVLCTIALVGGFTLPSALSAQALGGEPTILSTDWVTGSAITQAFGPSATLADNGDIVVLYNTDGDNIVGARVYVTRSSDEGATWTTPALIASPVHYLDGASQPIGSINTQASLTTLANGDLIAPATESISHHNYTNVESVTYLLRSTDDGVTWTGNGTPITLPTPMYYNATYGKVLELSNGDLLMPIWGATDAPSTPTGAEDPVRWQSGVARSTDGGVTWSDYSVIGKDEVMPQSWSNPHGSVPPQVSETSIVQLRDGRLLAVMRADHMVADDARLFWMSYSSDGGETWTDPVASDKFGTGHIVAEAPCSASLAGDTTKLFMAHNDETGPLVLRTSFDDGVSWKDGLALQDPPGATGGYAIYPNFVPLSGNRMMVVYNRLVTGATRIAFNIIQDATGTTCQDQANDAATAAQSTLSVFVEREDKGVWPWPYARRERVFDASANVGASTASIAKTIICDPTGVTLSVDGDPLDPALSFAANGVENGDVIVVHGAHEAGAKTVGIADHDEYPGVRPLYGWSNTCDTTLALDYRLASIGVDMDLASGQIITSFNIRDSDASTRLTAGDYRLWESSDNKNWTEVTGWTFASNVVNGRLTHSFNGIAVANRYLKLSQSKADSAWTFLINSYRDDVWVTTNPNTVTCS